MSKKGNLYAKNYNFIELNEKFKIIKKLGWIQGDKNNYGAGGILFEKLLGNTFHNFEIPDYNGIEIKTKTSIREEYLSLFSAVPDSFLFEIKRIVEKYGYSDNDFPQYNIFNLDVYTFKYNKAKSQFYFKLKVDDKEKNIILEVYDKNFNIIDTNTKWSFDLLKEKIERKLQCLAFIKAEKHFSHNELYYRYNEIKYYKLRGFDDFINLLKKGLIKITFRIGIYKKVPRVGNIYDHGSSFCIKTKNLEKLFQKVSINN